MSIRKVISLAGKQVLNSLLAEVIVGTQDNRPRQVSIKLYDKNGDLFHVADKDASINWSYRRFGGCGQANLVLSENFDFKADSIEPQTSVKVFIDSQLRYTGKLVDISRSTKSKREFIKMTLFGYVVELNDVVIKKTYEGNELGAIVKDILDSFVVPNTKITYSSGDIETTDYAVSSLVLNHSAKSAINLLAGLAGNFEWGVDRDKKFYFKKRDRNIRNVYIIGRDIDKYKSQRKDESVVNVLNVYGSDGTSPIVAVQSTQSISKFGRKEKNEFESAISEISDANRLAASVLKAKSKSQRRVKFNIIKDDAFVEESTPLGAVATQKNVLSVKHVYSKTANKYGRHIKYGNMKRDQVSDIRYSMIGGGLKVQMSLNEDIPNLAAEQKQIRRDLKDLQRRN